MLVVFFRREGKSPSSIPFSTRVARKPQVGLPLCWAVKAFFFTVQFVFFSRAVRVNDNTVPSRQVKTQILQQVHGQPCAAWLARSTVPRSHCA